MIYKKQYFCIFAIVLIVQLCGCAKEKNLCGDPKTINQLEEILKKNFDEPEKLSVKIIFTQKSKKENNKNEIEGACKGSAEISVRDDILKKFNQYNELIKKELGVQYDASIMKPYQFDFEFQILKNEASGGRTISTQWEKLGDKVDYTPIRIFDKIDYYIQNIPLAKLNIEVEKWLENDSRIVKDWKNYIDSKEELKIKSCSKVMDMEKDVPDLNIFCFYENAGGELTTVSSIPQPLAKLAKNASDNPIVGLIAGNLAGIGLNLPIKMTKLKDEEMKNYFNSDLRIEFSELKSHLY
jgi:hypothetical protein